MVFLKNPFYQPAFLRFSRDDGRSGFTSLKYAVDVIYHCKPFTGDWNGSGMHCNFSTDHLRDAGGKEYFEKLMGAFEKYTDEHIAVYGPDNHMRLTGLHETQSIDQFSYGVADRGASVRVPHAFVKDDAYQGYLEDRRPNSEGRSSGERPAQLIESGRFLRTASKLGARSIRSMIRFPGRL